MLDGPGRVASPCTRGSVVVTSNAASGDGALGVRRPVPHPEGRPDWVKRRLGSDLRTRTTGHHRRAIPFWALVTLVALVAAACLHAPLPDLPTMRLHAQELSSTFSTLSDLRVLGYRAQDWCRAIAYRRGSFATNAQESTCPVTMASTGSFDRQATVDFDLVRQKMTDTGMLVLVASPIEYSADGQIAAAEFDVAGGIYDRWSYVFRSDGVMPQNDGSSRYVRIDANWYFWQDSGL